MWYSNMKLVWSYCKQHAWYFITLLLFSVVFTIVFFLYQLELEAVLYSVLLCLLLGSVIWAAGLICFVRKHRRLTSLRPDIELAPDSLPEPGNQIEQDYQQLLFLVFDSKAQAISLADRKAAGQLEYYTAWVHQIKTPIAALRLILQGEDTEQNQELLAELFKVEQYVDMVLAFSRMDSDTTDYVIRSCPLEEIVRQAVRKYAPLFIRKKLNLELRSIKGQVLTDEKWLCFVIEQLLSNAVKYTPSEGRIAIFQEGEGLLVVEDTGIGIAPEDVPRVCEKGFTGYNGRADKKASGIGLYLSRQILDRLGHNMMIQSEVGSGTRVTLDLRREDLQVE